MSTQKGHPPSSLRLRMARLSDSVINVLTVKTTKERGATLPTSRSLLISRVIIFFLSASLTMMALHTLMGIAPLHQNQTKADSQSLAPPIKALSVHDYPAVLVSESEAFIPKSAPTDKKEEDISLVTPKIEDEVTKSPTFDAAEEPFARMIVITMDREKSLRRLLKSLDLANFGEDHVDLDIWIDRPKEGSIHEGVLQASREIDWKYGTKIIHKRAVNAGLYQQWIYTWNITEETTEFAVILEDDLEVSPAFYQWLRVARAAYAQDADVGAFTLQRPTLRPKQIKGVASGPLKIPEEHTVFKYKLLGTWGFAPQRDQWVEFRNWFEEKRARNEKPYVKGLMTTSWYKEQEVNGFAPTMWSQWWIKFVEEKGYFTVTANLPDGTTLAANWREAGLHYSKNKPKTDFPIFRGNEEQFVMPDDPPILVDWDGRIISASSSSNNT
ncbi:Nucleotide-diphospho-sugar transferase [Gracilaria domingensis]|nr:Nucleotide-diphospho-sugar transferase [Gracilaria domingensis]